MDSPKHALRTNDGQTFAERVRAVLSEVVGERVLLVGPPEVLPDLPHTMDHPRGLGPLSGINAAMIWANETGISSNELLILPCDAPNLTSELLLRLVKRVDRAAACFGSSPLPLRLSRQTHEVVQRRLGCGEYALRDLIAELHAGEVALEAAERELLANINTPEEYQAYLASSRR